VKTMNAKWHVHPAHGGFHSWARRPCYAVILLTLCLSACVSAPDTRFYTLDMNPSGTAKPGVHLNIVRVETLEPLAHAEILIQTSPTQIEYYAEDAWSASLQEIVKEKLRTELGEKQPGQSAFDLCVKVQAFQQVDTPTGAEAWAKLIAEVREEGASLYATPLFEYTYEARIPAATPEANAVVLALGDCLEQIAAQLATDTKDLQAPTK